METPLDVLSTLAASMVESKEKTGRGHGQLTQNAIRKLTIYYNNCYSTDSKPRHELCPVGADSWCFYQTALAQHQVPGPHKTLIHTPLNHEKLHQHLKPVYERLTDTQLLSRCVSGKTQNSNECLHSLIWSRCAKDKFASRRRVQFAVFTAISEFNFGPAAAQDTASFFGFHQGAHMKRLGASRQKKRERNSVKFQKDKANKRLLACQAEETRGADAAGKWSCICCRTVLIVWCCCWGAGRGIWHFSPRL
ncbi:hypothetical protein ACOMHN_028109 [Nucella lapillus]